MTVLAFFAATGDNCHSLSICSTCSLVILERNLLNCGGSTDPLVRYVRRAERLSWRTSVSPDHSHRPLYLSHFVFLPRARTQRQCWHLIGHPLLSSERSISQAIVPRGLKLEDFTWYVYDPAISPPMHLSECHTLCAG
ncbi:hypothetical protein BDW68DRAFT_170008 [Aspergillus falconensis]